MTVHTLHADTHTHGLADDCPRCEEIGEEPFYNMDESSLRHLWMRWAAGEPARSYAEQIAYRELENLFSRLGGLARAVGTYPIAARLAEKWNAPHPESWPL